MRTRGPRTLLWLLTSTIAYTACDGTGDDFPPGLTFFGTVRNVAGSGVQARVEVQERIDCMSSTIVWSDTNQTWPDGTYELHAGQNDLDLCYLALAASFDGALASDTIRSPGRQLDQRGDPLGTGRIPLDIVVR